MKGDNKQELELDEAFCGICKKITDSAAKRCPTVDILCDCLYMLGDMLHCYNAASAASSCNKGRETSVFPPFGGTVYINVHQLRFSEMIASVFDVDITYNKTPKGSREWRITGHPVYARVAGMILILLCNRWKQIGTKYLTDQKGTKEERKARRDEFFAEFISRSKGALLAGMQLDEK